MPSNVKLLAGASGGEPTDANFKNVTLLLHGDGSNGAQNNTFIDSSTNNFTITRNGNTTQGSFSPYGSNWSNYFDGSGDYLTISSNAAFDFGTSDFTIECWFLMNSSSSNMSMVNNYNAGTSGWGIQYRSDVGEFRFFWGDTVLLSYAATPTIGAWTHIAVARSGTSLKMYINGSQVASATNSTSLSGGSSVVIGAINASGYVQNFNGYISNVRVLKGTALYTSAFTPSTTPLTAITNTSLLTCAYNRFRDGSTNNFTITRNGDVKVTNFAPFAPSSAYSTTTNGGSAYFDGSGDYLTVPDNAVFDLGSGNLAIELFAYINSYTDGNLVVLFSNYQDASNGWTIGINSATSKFYGSISGNATVLGDTNALIRGAWNHIVLCRTGSTVSLFVNGTRVATGTDTTNVTSTSNVHIGSAVGGSYNLNGYIASARVIKGSNPYDATQSTLTVPTSPLTAITNTSLLTNFTNAAIFDNSMKNDLETVGNAQISTSVKKFGTGSMYFDGTGDYLASRMSSDLVTFGNGDFTIEMWIYFNDVTTLQCFYDQRPSGTQGAYPAIYVESGTLRFNSNTTDLITTSVSTGQWYHIAVTRSGNTTRLFKDGVSAGTYGTLINYLNGGDGRPGIGGGGFSTSTFFLNGYIDDLRITKGVARYTANFTAPTAPFPNK